MNQKLVQQTKEYLLEILDWSNDSNRKLAVQCIGEIAEEALQSLNEYLEAEEKKVKTTEDQQCFENDCCQQDTTKE